MASGIEHNLYALIPHEPVEESIIALWIYSFPDVSTSIHRPAAVSYRIYWSRYFLFYHPVGSVIHMSTPTITTTTNYYYR